jgi:hypothetical protein
LQRKKKRPELQLQLSNVAFIRRETGIGRVYLGYVWSLLQNLKPWNICQLLTVRSVNPQNHELSHIVPPTASIYPTPKRHLPGLSEVSISIRCSG